MRKFEFDRISQKTTSDKSEDNYNIFQKYNYQNVNFKEDDSDSIQINFESNNIDLDLNNNVCQLNKNGYDLIDNVSEINKKDDLSIDNVSEINKKVHFSIDNISEINKNDSSLRENHEELEYNNIEKYMEIIFPFKNDDDEISELKKNLLGNKRERNNAKIENESKKTKSSKKIFFKVNDCKEHFNYRHDYYIMDFKSDFLKFSKKKLNDLINKIKLCKKFGKHNIHTPNRELYGGNPKEEDNREFIYKTVEEVFIDQGEQKNDESRQKSNEDIFKRIKEYQKKLKTKLDKDKKYQDQYDAIDELKNFLKKPIKDVLDEYYDDSEEFGEFRSQPKILYYDKQFMKERGRNLSLLVKNNFVKIVTMPYYSNKNKKK